MKGMERDDYTRRLMGNNRARLFTTTLACIQLVQCFTMWWCTVRKQHSNEFKQTKNSTMAFTLALYPTPFIAYIDVAKWVLTNNHWRVGPNLLFLWELRAWLMWRGMYNQVATKNTSAMLLTCLLHWFRIRNLNSNPNSMGFVLWFTKHPSSNNANKYVNSFPDILSTKPLQGSIERVMGTFPWLLSPKDATHCQIRCYLLPHTNGRTLMNK